MPVLLLGEVATTKSSSHKVIIFINVPPIRFVSAVRSMALTARLTSHSLLGGLVEAHVRWCSHYGQQGEVFSPEPTIVPEASIA
jgi:hypothetical protein